jgi:hypothetical protein
MRTLIALTLALSLVSTTGCKRVVKGIIKANQTAASGASASGEDPPNGGSESEDDALGEKLNAYIDCINSVSGRVHDSERRYFSWADEKKGPTGKERNIYGLYSISDPTSCVNGVTKAKTAKPSLPKLEEAGAAYTAAASKAFPLLKEANDYYNQKNYQDDKMAKGKELHPKLVALFDEFDKADTAMRAEVHTLNRQLKERTLANLEKTEGKKIPYLHSHLMLLAEDVVKLGDAGKLEAIDLPKLTAKIDEYEKAVNELSTYVGAHKDEAGKFMMIDSLVSEAKDYLVAAKELMRRVRDKTPYSTGEKMNLGGAGEWMVNGSPGKLVHEYNDLVGRSNSVRNMP